MMYQHELKCVRVYARMHTVSVAPDTDTNSAKNARLGWPLGCSRTHGAWMTASQPLPSQLQIQGYHTTPSVRRSACS